MYFSSALVQDLMNYATLRQQDAKALLEKYGHLLNQKHIDYKTTSALLNNFGRTLQDDNLGLHIGERISLKVTAYVNSIMQYSETLEDAFDNGVRYSKQISDALASTLIKNKNNYALVFEENPNWKVYSSYAKKQILDLTLLSALKSITTYTNQKYFPIYIGFKYSKPRNLNEYFRLFNCSLKFNHPTNEIVFEQKIFKKYVKKTDAGLLENLIKKIKVEIDSLSQEHEVIHELKKCILKHKPERISINQAAEEMLLSKRTLQRRLKELNTNYKKIEFELLLKLSKTYLEENEKSIEEICYLLGFSESSTFIRFFKSQTLQTPLEYRKKCYQNN